jgi:hypothetical protein
VIDLLRRVAHALRSLPGLPLRVAELEMRVQDIEHDLDSDEAILRELYTGPTERAA